MEKADHSANFVFPKWRGDLSFAYLAMERNHIQMNGKVGKAFFCSFTRSNTWPLIRHNAKNSKPCFSKRSNRGEGGSVNGLLFLFDLQNH